MRVIFYLLVAVELCNAFSDTVVISGNNITNKSHFTVHKKCFDKVLSRKKRWFVFPKGANALITMVVTKYIIGGMPRGLQESIEVEMGFSLPPGVEGWRSEIWGPTANLAQQNSNTVKSNVVAKPKIDVFIDNYNNWQPDYVKNRINVEKLPISDRRHHIGVKKISLSESPRKILFHKRNNKARIPSWHHHREYRERRQIFEKFESFGKYLGNSLKFCIMRAICEVKNELYPEGESFIQDVARIVFTLPIDLNFEDEYLKVARDEPTNCARKFLVTCPYSPMAYFLQNTPKAKHFS